ncbi:MAG: hypothetical protein H5T40_06870 [Methanobacteriales archaeon]|nr:hypothetical protein [Methanobacteriales archaeon]MBC7118736.1 hypothetical protein [Methanobacteriaceae archaeon]
MKAEYLILGLVILAGLAVGYTFFQISDQNGIRFDKSNIDTNKSVPTDQGGSSSQGTSSSNPDQGGSSSQGTSSSNQVNNPNQRHICPTCGGNGYIEYTEENGELSVEICPTCGGSGYI